MTSKAVPDRGRKDWPPSEDFKEQFPELFDDFEGAVPMPDVTRRDGVRNIAAHFAKNANIPDLYVLICRRDCDAR